MILSIMKDLEERKTVTPREIEMTLELHTEKPNDVPTMMSFFRELAKTEDLEETVDKFKDKIDAEGEAILEAMAKKKLKGLENLKRQYL